MSHLVTLVFSQRVSDTMHFIHAGVDRPNIIGENLAMVTAESKGYSVKQAIASWYTQGLKYDYTNEISNPATGEEHLANDN